jgi:hypothetical protein
MELITQIIEIFPDDRPTFSKEFNIEAIGPGDLLLGKSLMTASISS